MLYRSSSAVGEGAHQKILVLQVSFSSKEGQEALMKQLCYNCLVSSPVGVQKKKNYRASSTPIKTKERVNLWTALLLLLQEKIDTHPHAKQVFFLVLPTLQPPATPAATFLERSASLAALKQAVARAVIAPRKKWKKTYSHTE